VSRHVIRMVGIGTSVLLLAGAVLLRQGGESTAAPQTPAPAGGDNALDFVIKPYLQFPTLESIVILWETTAPGTSVVEYGLNNKLKEKVALDEKGTMHEVPLKNLKPNTRYFYKVTTKDAEGRALSSELLTFCTAVDAYAAYSFGVIGDTQKNPKVTGQVAKLIWERRPNFVIHVGDVVDNGPDKKEWVHELFGPSAPLLARVAVFPTIGNHERNHAHYYKYFSLPKPEYYYRYRYGNADFFVLDSNKSLKPDSEQYKWLDRELARSDATWKFAYHHHPAYSSDDDDYGNTWRGDSTFGDMNVRNLVALYEKHNVDVVFNGHIHVYERTWPLRAGKVDRKKGVVYVTSGGGGGSLENFAPNRTWFQAEVRVDYHFCHVTIHGGRFNLKAFDKDGRLFDFFDIEK
jgi:predicted phosphodiesterase